MKVRGREISFDAWSKVKKVYRGQQEYFRTRPAKCTASLSKNICIKKPYHVRSWVTCKTREKAFVALSLSLSLSLHGCLSSQLVKLSFFSSELMLPTPYDIGHEKQYGIARPMALTIARIHTEVFRNPNTQRPINSDGALAAEIASRKAPHPHFPSPCHCTV